MKKLTKRKALELTAELWDWVSENGGKKYEWPGWTTQEDIDLEEDDRSYCFLCAYTGSDNCDKCPLSWTGEEGSTCTDNESPYMIWENSIDLASPKARQAAKRIADLCREELARMEKPK